MLSRNLSATIVKELLFVLAKIVAGLLALYHEAHR